MDEAVVFGDGGNDYWRCCCVRQALFCRKMSAARGRRKMVPGRSTEGALDVIDKALKHLGSAIQPINGSTPGKRQCRMSTVFNPLHILRRNDYEKRPVHCQRAFNGLCQWRWRSVTSRRCKVEWIQSGCVSCPVVSNISVARQPSMSASPFATA